MLILILKNLLIVINKNKCNTGKKTIEEENILTLNTILKYTLMSITKISTILNKNLNSLKPKFFKPSQSKPSLNKKVASPTGLKSIINNKK